MRSLVVGLPVVVRAAAAGVAVLAGLAFVATGAGPAIAAPATQRDDAGRDVTLAAPPRRVVSLAPSLTELVFAVGAGDAVVGVDAWSDFPPAAKALPRVGDHQRFDVERIVALKPDLVLVWQSGNPGREVAQLAALGLPLFFLEPRRLADVPRALERVGTLFGRGDDGRAAAGRLRAALEQLRERHRGAPVLRVFYQAWREPLLTLNGEHLVSDVIALCGGRNVFAAQPQLVPAVSLEAAVATDPEVLLADRTQQADGEGARREPRHPEFASWARLRDVAAVRGGWMFTLPGDTISRQGPRIDQGARAVCEALDAVRAAGRR